MDKKRRFVQSGRPRRLIGGVVAVAVLMASGVLVGVGVAGTSVAHLLTTTVSTSSTTTTIPTSGKVTICHHTHSKKNPMVTISVNVRAWPAHARHGDSVGACVRTTTTTATTTGTTTTVAAPLASGPGRSGQHASAQGQTHGQGQGNGHGKGNGH